MVLERKTYLDRLLETEGVLFTEANASPFEHLGLLSEVRDSESLVLSQQWLILRADEVIDFVEQVFAALNPLLSF